MTSEEIDITFTQPDKVKKIGPGEYLINIAISKAERNKALIRDLFRSIRGWCSPDFVRYVWENDTEAPSWVKELCAQYFEEWAIDAKDLSVDKASERTYYKILKYYGM